MGLESGEFIPDLVRTNPASDDPVSQGDDALRLIKKCVQNSFGAFVGSEAVPKSVAFTEDQINDLAQKAIDESIGGNWRFATTLELANDAPVIGFETDALTKHQLLRINTSEIAEVLAPTINGFIDCLATLTTRVNSAVVAAYVTRALGSLLVNDIDGTQRKVGFRNPGINIQNAAYTFLQSDEGQIVQQPGPAGNVYTVPTLEAGTAILVINDDNNDTCVLRESGVQLSGLLGGSEIAAAPDLTILPKSVVQLYWADATTVRAWGNGIT